MLDWVLKFILTRNVIEGAFVAVLVGGPLSVYLAFMVNRLATFRQIKLGALAEIATIKKATLEATDYMAAYVYLRWLLEIPCISMAAEDQWSAFRQLTDIRSEIRKHFTEEGFDKRMLELGLDNRRKFQGEVWLKEQQDFYIKSAPQIRDWVLRVYAVKPDFLYVLGVIPRNETLKRWEKYTVGKPFVHVFDFLRNRKKHIENFAAYCRGEADDWK